MEKNWSKVKKILRLKKWSVFLLLAGVLGVFLFFKLGKKESFPQYQTAKVERGTIKVTVSASGQVLSANSATVETQASGVVKKIYVENGQKIKAGEKIAELELDLIGKQRAAQALSSYQSAQNSLETAKINFYTLQSEMLTKWKSYMDTAQSATYQNPDGSPKTDTRQLPQFVSLSDDWLAAEAKYKNQEKVVQQAQNALQSAWLSYQQTSPVIFAPISGTITGFSLQVGSVLTAQSNSSGGSASQKIANIVTGAPPIVAVNLTQVDVPKVKIGTPAVLTFDAFPEKTFTGKVISIDTIGTVNSGVTTYPAAIKLDSETPEIFSNMTATVTLLIEVKDNVLFVPISALQKEEEENFVRVLKNGQVEERPVKVGLSSESEVEILSGLSEGETVITAVITSSRQQGRAAQTQSPFGMFGGGVRIRR